MTSKYPLKYLLVEDSLSDAKLFQIVWNEVAKGQELITFSNAPSLLSYLIQLKDPSRFVIVLDLNLPGMNGIDCLAALRQMEVTRFSPIVIFSTSTSENDVSRAYLNGATSYVQKPSDLNGLKSFISSLFSYWSHVIPASQKSLSHQELTKLAGSTDIKMLIKILETLPNMVFVKEAKELRFVYFNRAGEKLLGMSKEILIGKNDYDFFPVSQADFFTAKDKAVLSTGKEIVIQKEEINTAKLGLRKLHTRKVPLYLNSNSSVPSHLLGISDDITED